MRVVGQRFWTWMSVWVLSFFVKGELTASPSGELDNHEASSTQGGQQTKTLTPDLKRNSSKQHKVPSGPHSKSNKQDKWGSADITLQAKDKDHKINSANNMSEITQKGGSKGLDHKTGTNFKNNSRTTKVLPHKTSK